MQYVIILVVKYWKGVHRGLLYTFCIFLSCVDEWTQSHSEKSITVACVETLWNIESLFLSPRHLQIFWLPLGLEHTWRGLVLLYQICHDAPFLSSAASATKTLSCWFLCSKPSLHLAKHEQGTTCIPLLDWLWMTRQRNRRRFFYPLGIRRCFDNKNIIELSLDCRMLLWMLRILVKLDVLRLGRWSLI